MEPLPQAAASVVFGGARRRGDATLGAVTLTVDELITRFPLVNDHPDVAGVLRQPDLLAAIGPLLAGPYRSAGVTKVIAPEARGPILGGLVAVELAAGLVLGRRAGTNHPGADVEIASEPTWRGQPSNFIARSFDLEPDDRVLVVDDWITTGNSIRSMIDVVERAGATHVGTAVLVDKTDESIRDELRVTSLAPFARLCG